MSLTSIMKMFLALFKEKTFLLSLFLTMIFYGIIVFILYNVTNEDVEKVRNE